MPIIRLKFRGNSTHTMICPWCDKTLEYTCELMKHVVVNGPTSMATCEECFKPMIVSCYNIKGHHEIYHTLPGTAFPFYKYEYKDTIITSTGHALPRSTDDVYFPDTTNDPDVCI